MGQTTGGAPGLRSGNGKSSVGGIAGSVVGVRGASGGGCETATDLLGRAGVTGLRSHTTPPVIEATRSKAATILSMPSLLSTHHDRRETITSMSPTTKPPTAMMPELTAVLALAMQLVQAFAAEISKLPPEAAPDRECPRRDA